MSRTQINTSLIPSAYQANIALNGGFDLWTNGTSWPVNQDLTTPTDTADFWQSSYNGTAVFAFNQNSTTQESGKYALDIAVTSVGTTTRMRIVQFSQPSGTGITNPSSYAGKTLTFTARVKCVSVGTVSIMLEDSSGSTESAYNTTTGAYETLTVTRTMASNTTSLNLYIGYNSQNPVVGTVTIDSAMVAISLLPQVFVPSDPSIDKIRTMNPYLMAQNIMENGGFDIWQRGTTFTNPAAAAYTADRWQNNFNGVPVLTISKETTITDGSPAAFKWNLTSVGGGTVFMVIYRIEGAQYAGQTITLRARARVDSGGGGFVQFGITDAAGTTNQNTLFSGAATWETIVITRTLAANTSTITISMNFNNVPGVAYIDNVMLVPGEQAMPFVPMSPEVELARCQRYYETVTAEYNTLPLMNATGSDNSVQYTVNFKVSKRVTPTVTVTRQNFTTVRQNTSGASGNTDRTVSYNFTAQNITTEKFDFKASTTTALQTTEGIGSMIFDWTASGDF